MSARLLPPHPQTDVFHPGLSCCDPTVREAVLLHLNTVADAARAYVAARLANDAAEPKDWTHHAAELDRTWHNLLEASGLAMPEAGAVNEPAVTGEERQTP